MAISYIKFTDRGEENSHLYWAGVGQPPEELVQELDLRNGQEFAGPYYWRTTLEKIGKAGYELVYLYAYGQKTQGNFIKNIHLYIFKKQ